MIAIHTTLPCGTLARGHLSQAVAGGLPLRDLIVLVVLELAGIFGNFSVSNDPELGAHLADEVLIVRHDHYPTLPALGGGSKPNEGNSTSIDLDFVVKFCQNIIPVSNQCRNSK